MRDLEQIEAAAREAKAAPTKADFLLGRAIAEMYIAAQHVSQHASNSACAAMEGASAAMRFGFNSRMSQSPYATRAL